MNQARIYATRTDDERMLFALMLRDMGHEYTDVAAMLGKTAGYWRVVIGRVNRDYAASERRA